MSGEELSMETDGPKVDDVGDSSKDKLGKEEHESNKNEEANEEIFENTIEEQEHSQPGEIVTISDDSSQEEEDVVIVKRRKTEVEKLDIENLEFKKPLKNRRPKVSSCTNQFCSAHWVTSIDQEECGQEDIAGGKMQELIDKLVTDLGTGENRNLGLEYGAAELESFGYCVDLDEEENGFLM